MPDPSLAPDPAPCLLVPCASSLDAAARQALSAVRLPHLTELLHRLVEARSLGSDEWSFTPPHERALADAMDLAGEDGALPWAAMDSDQPQEPQAWFHPVHFQVGMDQVALQPATWLDDIRSRQLFEALAPLCREDGVELEFTSAHRWRARGERLGQLSCASLDRVHGRSVAPWQPRGPEAPWLRRLQSEAQMLFYTHPANDALAAAGLAPVNGFWADGVGAVTGSPRAPGLRLLDDLRPAALLGDWSAWIKAWEQLDATELARLLDLARRGKPVRLILCGERRAVELAPRPRHWLTGWTRHFRRAEHPASLLESL